jgi:anaerobic selenocysteine-containing dehydrogenase
MGLGRRDLLKLLGGGTAGFFLTPVPWRLIGGVAIRTQNWPGVPDPPRGEVRTRYTTCTLCPAACGVRARCVVEQPVSLAGVAAHPSSAGVLCPAGLCGHHLPLLPGRVREPLARRGGGFQPVSIDTVAGAVAAALADMRRTGSAERVAVLDARPGRTASLIYRRWLKSAPNGMYLLAPSAEAAGPMGIDIERTGTVLSFGAPVLDGWGTPGRVLEARRSFRLIQVETRQSRTALLADGWLPIRPGTEAALALGIANVLIGEKLNNAESARNASDFAAYAALASQFPPRIVAGLTGVPPETIVAAAHDFVAHGPAVAIAASDPGGGPLGESEQIAIAALNVLTGSLGREGGFLPRGEAPRPPGFEETALVPENGIAEAPDGSIRILIVDDSRTAATWCWSAIERKLAGGHIVVALTQFLEGAAQHADFAVPVPAYLEAVEDAPAPPDVPAAMFSLAGALVKQTPHAVEGVDFLHRVAGGGAALADVQKQRVASIHASRRGEVFHYADGARTAVRDIKSAEDLWKTLEEGGCWIDRQPGPRAKVRVTILGGAGDRVLQAAAGRLPPDARFPLALLPYGWSGAAVGAVSPIMSKLYQESTVRPGGDAIEIHPDTARQCALADGDLAIVETRCGSCTRQVRTDDAVMPGVIQAEVCPSANGNCRPEALLNACGVAGDGTWRLARASLRRA